MKKDLESGLVLPVIALLYYAATNSIAETSLSDEVGATGLPLALTTRSRHWACCSFGAPSSSRSLSGSRRRTGQR